MARLGDICDILNGYAFKSENYISSGIRVIRIANVQKGYIEDTAPAFYPIDTPDIEKYILYEDDLLISLTGNVGRVALLSKEFLPAALNQRVACLRLKDGVPYDKSFLYCFLNSDYFENKCIQSAKGVAQKNMSTEWLKDYEIPNLSLEEQKEIATVLNKVSELITARTQQLSTFDNIVKSRFIEMFGDPRNNPNSFNVVSFNDCVEYMGDIGSNGANKVVVDHLDMKDEEDYALMVRFLNFTKNDFTDDVKYISKEAYDFFKKSQIFGGELIICKIGSAGQNYIMPFLNRPVSLGLNQIMVRINDKTIMPYLYQYLNTDYGKQLIDGCINGAVTKSITKTELKKIPVIVPPIDLQNEFATFVEQTDKLKFEVKEALEKLETLKKSLMQQYFG